MGKEKHLIIGAGPAALNALQTIKRTHYDDDVMLFTKEDCLPYSPTVLPYLLSGNIDKSNIWIKDETYFKKIGAVLQRGMEAVEVDSVKRRVTFADGTKESYDKLLIATGSMPVRPSINGLNESVFLGFGNIRDCGKLLGLLQKQSEVAVLGGGLVGVEVAIGLAEKGHQVTIIEKEERLLPLYFDREAESIIRRVFLEKGLKTLTGMEATQVKRRNGNITIEFSEGNTITSDILVTCVGVIPNTDFLQNAGLRINKGILVDRAMKTNAEDIYAAGDAAEAPEYFTGDPGLSAIMPSAVNQGKVAGANMCGLKTEYKGWIALNKLPFFGNIAESLGIATKQGGEFSVIKDINSEKGQYKKLVFNGDTLVGCTFINHDVNLGPFYQIIERELDVGKYKDLLFDKPTETSIWLIREDEKKKTRVEV